MKLCWWCVTPRLQQQHQRHSITAPTTHSPLRPEAHTASVWRKMGVNFGFHYSQSSTLAAGQGWLLVLLAMQVVTEHFVFSYKSTWATEAPWASEWGDYYR